MTFASTAARGTTRHPLLWAALTLSLVLNLCFVAGALWTRFQAPVASASPAERLQRVGAELALDPQQKQAFERYAETLRTHMQKVREKVEPLMSAAWSELAKPDARTAKRARCPGWVIFASDHDGLSEP